MASLDEEEDLFGDQEVADLLLLNDFNAAEVYEGTPNANDDGNGNSNGPQQLPHGPKTPPRQHDNSQAWGGVPQPTRDLRLSPFSLWEASQAVEQQHAHSQEPPNPSVQDATPQAGGVQEIPIDPALDAYSQQWNPQAGGLPQPAQQEGLIDPSIQNPNPEAAPETNSNESDGTFSEFMRENGLFDHAPEQAPAEGRSQWPAPGDGQHDEQQNINVNNFNYAQFEAFHGNILDDQINQQPQGNIQVGGGPVTGATGGNELNAHQIQPADSGAPIPEIIFNHDLENQDVRNMSNSHGGIWLPESVSGYWDANQQGGPGPEAAAADGSNANQIQPTASAAPEQAAPAHGGQQQQNMSDQNFVGGPVPTHENQPNQQVSTPGSNVGQGGGATQQPQHENQHLTRSQAPQGGIGGHFQPENQQPNQNNRTENGQGGATQQHQPQFQQYTGQQAVPEIILLPASLPQDQHFAQPQAAPGATQQPHRENQQYAQPQAAPAGVGNYRYPDPERQQVNQFNNEYQQFGGVQTGQGQRGTDGQFNNGGQQQVNNGAQQFDNGQYGQQEAAYDLLNLGGGHAGQFHNQFHQLNNGQNGQGGTGGVNNTGYQQVGGGQFNNAGQQFNNVPNDQEVALDLLNLHNGHQQLGGAQTGYATGGSQFNYGSQHPSRVHTPQGGAGGYMAPGNQQPGQFNGMQHGQGGIGRQSNNGSQQASRAPTPQGGVSGYLAPVNQQLNQINGRQHGQGGASGYLDPGLQQYNSPQPLQVGGSGHLSPIPEDQPAGWPNVAGGNNQHLYPGNQQAAGSQYGAGGVVQPGPGYQQFPGSQSGVGGQPHPGVQPQPGHGSVSPHAVQNNNGGTPDPNHPPAIGSAPPELHPPPVVTPPVFPPGTLHPERWVAPGSGNEVVKIRASKFRNQSGGIHPHHVYYYRAHTQAWGTEYDEEGRPKGPAKLFSYANSQPLARAELVHSKQYTASQLSVFFRGEGHPNQPNRHLTLWIQNLPLLVSDRYAQTNASKCRYNECPVARGTITKGFHRIAFDEHSHHTGDYYDPYNNAGYMHLWCFEKAFDAGYLVWDVQERPGLYNFRIEADVRHHRFEEKNAASLNRDHNLHDTYRQWKNEQWDRYVRLRHQEANTGQRYNPFQTVVPDIPHDNCLWRRLTDKHVAEEVPARAKNRAKRTAAGNTIDNHRGDLVMHTRLDNERKARNGTPAPGGGSQQGTPAPLATSANKRKRNSAGDDDEEYQEGTPTPGSKKSRTSTSTTQTPNRSGNMGPPPLPSSSQRRTRRSSLALAHDLGEQLGNASESPLTRSRATFLGQQLNQLPEHLQEDVISHAPESVQVAISPLFLQNWRPENWGDVLRDRVSRMTPYHQGLLMQFAEKTERKGQLEGGKRRWRSDP